MQKRYHLLRSLESELKRIFNQSKPLIPNYRARTSSHYISQKPALLFGDLHRRSGKIAAKFSAREAVSQIRERLARCWVFAAPSIAADSGDTEGLGMVFLEAQSLNTPVVSFRSGGMVEAVTDGVSGLLCEKKDVATLADNMVQLLEISTLRHNMGSEGRKRIETKFDVHRQCAKLEQIYDELI